MTAVNVRKRRCRLLDEQLNRCTSETLSEDGIQLCAKHLAAAHADYLRLTGGRLTVLGKQTS
jgi:hypothetical protein